MTTVGIAGMTHLGFVSAAAIAARGFRVVCFDADTALIARLQKQDLHVVEPNLPELVKSNAGKQTFTAKPKDLSACDVVYIAADVPTDDEARSNLDPIRVLIDEVARNLNPSATLVVLCQVPPGFCRGLTAVPKDRLIYQVETLVFGRAVERAMHPERHIIGMADPSKDLPKHLETLLKAFDCPILKMRYESAELAKISINACLTASVSVANTLAEMCEAIGADWGEIVPALKLDRRIGPYSYLSPGLGISGGNLERDLRTLQNIGREHGTHVAVVDAWVDNSGYRKDWPWRTLESAVLAKNPDATIAVLGLAYKEDTHSTKNSPSLKLLSHLEGRNVRVHDPVVPPSVAPFAKGCKTAMECTQGADVLVIATPWGEYRKLSLDEIA